MKHGFSLVELSIVLVILGLLVGGIMLGQNLIRNAEVRSVSAEYERFRGAALTFKGQYRGLPGDLPNATRYWGQAAAGTACVYSTNTGTCDGDGDGVLTLNATLGETFRFWQQLSLAGLLEGSYTGAPDCASMSFGTPADRCTTFGVNTPASKLTDAGWAAINFGRQTGQAWIWDGEYGNSFMVGRIDGQGDLPESPALTPQEAYNVDRKLDDGLIQHGFVRGHKVVGCATTTSEATAEYDLSNTGLTCRLLMMSQF